jgi:recombination protein RecA
MTIRSLLLLQVLFSAPQATNAFALVPRASVAAVRKLSQDCSKALSAVGGEEEGSGEIKGRKGNSKKQQQKEDKSINNNKKAALDVVLANIERSYGRGSILQLGDADSMHVETISSGALTLDVALGGGYPKGRVVEIYGPESSGKTTLALHAIASVHARGGTAAFVDAEHALDPQYAANLGVCVDQLYVSQPDSGEMALDIVDQLVRSSAVDLIVVDSVAALVPRAELEGDMSDMQIGLQARLMSKALRKITGSLARSSCTVIFLNQLRSKVGVIFGSPEVTSGGNALKFYASVRLDTRRKEVLPDNMGIKVKVKVVKNKVAAPFQSAMFDILFKTGIDTYGCLLDAANDLDVVERRGSYYALDGKNFAQGRSNAIEYMKENKDFVKQIESVVRQKLLNDESLITGSMVENDPVDDMFPLSEDVEYASGIGIMD